MQQIKPSHTVSWAYNRDIPIAQTRNGYQIDKLPSDSLPADGLHSPGLLPV